MDAYRAKNINASLMVVQDERLSNTRSWPAFGLLAFFFVFKCGYEHLGLITCATVDTARKRRLVRTARGDGENLIGGLGYRVLDEGILRLKSGFVDGPRIKSTF